MRTSTIWHLLSNRWNSAITEYALSAARSLTLAGHACVFTPLANSPAADRARSMGLVTKPVYGFGLSAWAQLRALGMDIRPGATIVYGGPETVLSSLLPTAAIGSVLRFRGQPLVKGAQKSGVQAFVQSWRFQLAHRHVQLVIVPSQAMAVEQKDFAEKPRVVAIPLGCDVHRFYRPQGLEAWPLTRRPEVVVFGRLDPVKGHHRMIDVFALMLRAFPSVLPRPCLHIIGQEANTAVEELVNAGKARGLVLGDDLRFTAQRLDNVAEVLAGAVLGVVPSLGSEFICRVAQEFLLCGTPVLVSGVGSLNEVLITPEAGASWLGLPDVEAAALLSRWVQLGMSEGADAKMARSTVARRHFSLERMGGALWEHISTVLSATDEATVQS